MKSSLKKKNKKEKNIQRANVYTIEETLKNQEDIKNQQKKALMKGDGQYRGRSGEEAYPIVVGH